MKARLKKKLANARRPGRPMEDDERKAMFARMHGGGGTAFSLTLLITAEYH